MQNFYVKAAFQYSKKSCALLLLLLLLSISVSAMSQTMNEVKISLKVTQLPLKQIFAQIENRSGFIIGYDNDLDVNERFTLAVTDRPVSEVLHSLLRNYHEQLSQIDDKRILIKVTKKAATVVPPAKDPMVTAAVMIRGNVTDDLGNPLVG